jgi:mannose-1-phosphate guanylyltransferase
MLVAAGLGTRLDPLTRELPKPALPVGNRPVAWFALDALARSGIRDVVVNTHHLAPQLRAALQAHCPNDVALRFVHEPAILGTGGGVRNAWSPTEGEDFIVFNAKLLFAPDLERALAVHRRSRAIATLVLRALPSGGGFSPIETDADGRVRRIRGEPRDRAPGAERRMFTGVQILSARAHRDLPANGDIFEHAYIAWLARREHIASVTDDAAWFDVGVTPAHYLEANMALASGAVRWPGIERDAHGVIADRGARVSVDSQACDSVLGDGATVSDGASVRRVVAWPGAQVRGRLENAIVTTAGTVLRVV